MNSKIYLTNTDTTIGFLSQDPALLDKAKKRAPNKQYIQVMNSLKILKEQTRVPTKYKNLVRRAKKTTFIMPDGNSHRVITDKRHLRLLDRLKYAYSTSANLSNQPFNKEYAQHTTDITILPLDTTQSQPSSIYKVNNRTIKTIR